jgi:hypothetical protein
MLNREFGFALDRFDPRMAGEPGHWPANADACHAVENKLSYGAERLDSRP